MRLKSKPPWLAFPVLLMVAVVVFLGFSRRGADPILAGRPISHWLGVLEQGQAASVTDYNAAYNVLFEATGNRAALQAQILGRIEAAYSPSARLWHQIYVSLPPKVSARFPSPGLGRIDPQMVILLEGIMPEPSARQRAAIQKLLGDESPNNAWLISSALRVGLSPSTQTVPEAIALLREQLTTTSSSRRFLACGTICNQRGFEGWHDHREAVSGLVADLWNLATSAPGFDTREAARRALDKLPRDLGPPASTTTTSPADLLPEGLRAQPKPAENPAHPTDLVLTLETSRSASDLSLQLAPLVPAAWKDASAP